MEGGGLKRLEKDCVVCMQSELIREMAYVCSVEGNWRMIIVTLVEQLACWWYSVAMLSCLQDEQIW